jgi:cytochrome c-type biogenesis protein CcmH
MVVQYLITGLAGVALGIVGMRTWQAREQTPASHDGEASTPAKSPPTAPRRLLIGAGVLVAAAIGIFALRTPDDVMPPVDGVTATTSPGPSATEIADVDSMISRLAARLEKNPDDGEGFRMLGWSYVMTGHPDKALAPYKRALALLPASATANAGYGEALVGTQGGRVTDEAKAAFDKAIGLDPAEPRARYFLALWQAQHGQEKQALDKWLELTNSAPADAAWQPDLRRQITTTAARLGVDVSGRIKPVTSGMTPALPSSSADMPSIPAATLQSASALPQADRQAMIERMVEGLAARLKANPADADGWVRLMRSRMVQGQAAQAAKDLATARTALAGDKAGLKKVNAAATENAVPGAR